MMRSLPLCHQAKLSPSGSIRAASSEQKTGMELGVVVLTQKEISMCSCSGVL